MTSAIFRKQASSLVPVDEEGRALLAKIKDGRDVECEVIQRRNPRHHRLLFAMIKMLRDNTELFEGKDTEIVLTALKLATGYVRTYVDRTTGNTVMVPLSISFASMDQTRFSEWFDCAVHQIAERWFPGSDAETIRSEILAMVDPMRGAA